MGSVGAVGVVGLVRRTRSVWTAQSVGEDGI